MRGGMDAGDPASLFLQNSFTTAVIRFLQVGMCYATLKRGGAAVPTFHLTSLSDRNAPLRAALEAQGVYRWAVGRHEAAVWEVFKPQSLIYLSPDAQEPLPWDAPLDPAAVYVIGGVIDRTPAKGRSAGQAAARELCCRRLPFQEAFDGGRGGAEVPKQAFTLNVDKVLEALVHYSANGDWAAALRSVVPAGRYGMRKMRKRKEGLVEGAAVAEGAEEGWKGEEGSGTSVDLPDSASGCGKGN